MCSARSVSRRTSIRPGRAAACVRPHAHCPSCRSYCTRRAGAAGISPAERPGDPQVSGIRQVTAAGQLPSGWWSSIRSRICHDMDAPGLPGCLPASSSPRVPTYAAASSAASAPAGHPATAASMSSRCSATPPAPQLPAGPAGPRPSPPAPRSAPPAPRAASPVPGSAHHADPQAAHPATDQSRHAIIPETTPGNHGSTAPDAET
jgi:hypothetical protein